MKKRLKTNLLYAIVPPKHQTAWSANIRPGIIQESDMTFHLALQPVLAVLAGVLILAFPRLLNYIIAIYLIVYGVSSIVSP